MELSNTFEVKAPIDEAWAKLTDLELIAPAMPGAQLEEVEGDEYRGTVKVKVGPITAKYKGTAKIVEKDDDARMVIIDAKGRDTRGQGNANAIITAQLTEAGAGTTKVELVTDLTLTGKVAQFARGVLSDVSAKLIAQFVDNLESDVFGDAPAGDSDKEAPSTAAASDSTTDDTADDGEAATPEEVEASDADTPAATGIASVAKSSEPTAAAAAPAEVRKINSPEAEAVDLLDSAGAPLAKRLLPALGLLGIVLLIIRILRNRSSN